MRQILLSVLSLALVMAALGAGTWALFSDSETSSANTFATGTLDLQLRDSDEIWANGVKATWVMANMAPGDAVARWVDLRNFGTIQASSLVVSATNVVIDPPGPESDTEVGTTDMGKVLEIASCNFMNGMVVDCKALIADANGNGWKDLDDLQLSPVTAPWDPLGGTYTWEMTLRFHPSANSDYQGDILVTDISFTLVQ